MIRQTPIYVTAINGTITWLTLAIRLIPPIKTEATQNAKTKDEITTDHEYSPKNGRFTQCALAESKKP